MPCKKCKMIGHNSRTCKVLEPEIENKKEKEKEKEIKIKKESKKESNQEKLYYCYILQQDNKLNSLNYVGYTVNFNRRIRQHNCIIKGGARYTKNRGPWSFLAVMTCSSWNNIRAMQVEWLIKHPTRARRRQKCFSGSLGKINSLVEIFKRIPSEEKISIYIHSDFISCALNLNLSENVEIRQNLIDI
jgi:predicted GIY-YIG superfamily endonuclease